MDRMTRNPSKRDIIALVGMGGAGKTTLARSIYERQLIVDCFEVRLWVTISQQWSAREVLTEILLQLNHTSREALDEESEVIYLEIQLEQLLRGRKYLIVMDDFWSIEEWDKLKFYFPEDFNGSRIMITTRWSKLASDLAGSPLVIVGLVDEDKSWDLFCRKAFADGSCPLGLEEIGRKIARKCRGLPLFIVTIFLTVFLCFSISDSIMAANTSLLSLMHLIEQIQIHPDPPVPLDPKLAESLSKIIGFLQRFLEDSQSRGLAREERGFESRFADVAHAAEDVIESHGVCKILRDSASTDLYKTLQGVIEDMECIQEEFKGIGDKSGVEDDDHRPRRSSLLLPPLGSSPLTDNVVGFDDISTQIMHRMTRNQSKRDIIALVGMGGIGKTTLARSIYERQRIVDCFEMRLWVTISQQWSSQEALVKSLLSQVNQKKREGSEDSGTQLYQSLTGRRYLIVMDDVWRIEAWDKLKFFFPDNKNGSTIMITTRSSKLASDLAGSPNLVNVDLLDDDKSWDLFCRKAFVDGSCPLELEEIRRKIVRKCRGLPLSIVTIGGLLAKSDMTRREHLEYVAENLSSVVNSEGDERCLRILSVSYVHLPVHLKPCFLYMGLFPEDAQIRASHLIRLWVAEGLVKRISGKDLEAIGEDYLKDLVERNLVSVPKHTKWSAREIKYCSIHDLLRDLCIREARNENFFSVVRIDNNQQGDEINDTQRRIAIHRWRLNPENSSSHSMQYPSPLLRTCIIDCGLEVKRRSSLLGPVQHRLIRILAASGTCYDDEENVPLMNLRFLSIKALSLNDVSFILSTNRSLQTLTADINQSGPDDPPLDIWNMSQLRHVQFEGFKHARLSDPPHPSSEERLVVLENLQTLSVVITDFVCSKEVVKRIPNIKKFSIYYSDYNVGRRTPKDYCLNNLGRLQKLESLTMELCLTKSDSNWLDGLTLPSSLKKLSLRCLNLDNETLGTVIGGLLKLSKVSFAGDEWNPVEDRFCKLRKLELRKWRELKHWNVDRTHFPLLEHLVIGSASSLEEFPSGIGDIQTLRSIELRRVRDSVVFSAKRMQEEQEEEYGNDGFKIEVHVIGTDQAERLKSLESNNFEIQIFWSSYF